jgi:hypothetical protein
MAAELKSIGGGGLHAAMFSKLKNNDEAEDLFCKKQRKKHRK